MATLRGCQRYVSASHVVSLHVTDGRWIASTIDHRTFAMSEATAARLLGKDESRGGHRKEQAEVKRAMG